MTVTIWPIFLLFIANLVGAIRIEKVEVPRMVVTGRTIELQCLYTEEDHELYTLKWWRGTDQFYQYVPPRRNFFPTTGVRVDMNATTVANRNSPIGLERVILNDVGLDTAGVYKCEVMADGIFQTVSMESNMTVVYPPSGPPSIYGINVEDEKVRYGQFIVVKCSSPPASPAPKISWRINDRQPDSDWVNSDQTSYVGSLPKSTSRLEFVVDQKIIQDSYGKMVIECEAEQMGSAYRKSDQIVLIPEKSSYFWFFGSGATSLSTLFTSTITSIILLAANMIVNY